MSVVYCVAILFSWGCFGLVLVLKVEMQVGRGVCDGMFRIEEWRG